MTNRELIETLSKLDLDAEINLHTINKNDKVTLFEIDSIDYDGECFINIPMKKV
jgi:hypothetical protein